MIHEQQVYIVFFLLLLGAVLVQRGRGRGGRPSVLEELRKYLLSDDTTDIEARHHLANSRRPILWIHVPYELNARVGGRNSWSLNQPYLYLTMETILRHCDESFTVCIIDDRSFTKLLPSWKLGDLATLSDPLLRKVRYLGFLKLLHMYGGIVCPLSTICMRDFAELLQHGGGGEVFFEGGTLDDPFLVASKENPLVQRCGEEYQRRFSEDPSSEADRFHTPHHTHHTHTMSAVLWKPTLDDLFSEKPPLIPPSNSYGILVPRKDLLRRNALSWFAVLPPEEALNADIELAHLLREALKHRIHPSPTKRYEGYWKAP
jgi:hypothetical protein